MFLKSSSDSTTGTLGMGVTYSLTHCLGYSPDLVMALKMSATGLANSAWNSLFIFGGISPLTDDNLNLRDLNFWKTWNASILGISFEISFEIH